MDALKVNIDSVYKLLKNQNILRRNAEIEDTTGYKRDFRHVDFIRRFNNSSYQKPPPKTEGSRIELMLDQVLENQKKLIVNFNDKIDNVYTDLSLKIKALNARLKKVEVEEILTRNTVQRYETYIQRRNDEAPREYHHE